MRLQATALTLVLAVIGSATAHAHGGSLFISRDTTGHAQLQADGPSDYIEGRTRFVLIRGDAQFTGFWFTDAPGISTLSEDGLIWGRRRLLPGHRVALELIRADRGFSMLEPSTFRVVLAHPKESYEFVRDPRGDFSLQMVSRVDGPGTYSATFRFIDRAGLHSPSRAFTLRFTTDAPRDSLAAPQIATYYDAVRDLKLRLVDAASAIADRTMSRAADQTAAMWTPTRNLPRLARAAGSGVATSSIEAVEVQSAALDAAVAALHQVIDLGDSSAALVHMGAMSATVDSLAALAPRRFMCPMGCEGGRTYSAPGRCPVCGGKLMDSFAHLDHNPRHGGQFIMTPDFEHHLEVVLGDMQLRVYLYDEFTRPIAADSVEARLEFPTSSPLHGRRLALTPGPETGCLAIALPRQGPLPREASLVLRFAGAGEQSYSVRLMRPKR